MIKTILVVSFSLLQLSVSAQEKYKKEITGKLPLKIFSKDAELKLWFGKEYESCHPDQSVLKNLKQHLAGKKITVVLGTWCSDSQELFPRLMKVLKEIHFPLNDLRIYGMNKKKTIPAKIVAKYKITNVPTIIILNADGTEKGRITETVTVSVEADLESILK